MKALKFVLTIVVISTLLLPFVAAAQNPDFIWGPAGAAPQTEPLARQALSVTADTPLTVVYPLPGNDTVIGWIIGTTTTQFQGKKWNVGNLPAGVCVDFDPHATSLTANEEDHKDLTPKWRRAYLKSNGSANTAKMTVFWTPCSDKEGTMIGDGTISLTSPVTNTVANATPAPKPTQVAQAATPEPQPTTVVVNCPTFGGTATKLLPDGGCKYKGSVVTAPVPDQWSAQYWDGKSTRVAGPGVKVSSGELTLYPLDSATP